MHRYSNWSLRHQKCSLVWVLTEKVGCGTLLHKRLNRSSHRMCKPWYRLSLGFRNRIAVIRGANFECKFHAELAQLFAHIIEQKARKYPHGNALFTSINRTHSTNKGHSWKVDHTKSVIYAQDPQGVDRPQHETSSKIAF